MTNTICRGRRQVAFMLACIQLNSEDDIGDSVSALKGCTHFTYTTRTHARMHAHTHTHTDTHTHYIPKSHLSSDTSSKDLFTVTAFRRAAVTEGWLPHTVSFCSEVHFERTASTTDGRVTPCKVDGVTCMSCDTKYHKQTRG